MNFKLLEENPALAIGGAAVLVLLFSMRGGSGNASAMIQAQLQAQKTAGQTDVALAKINADQAQARTASLADVYKTSIVSRAQVLGTQDTNASKVALGMAGFQTQQSAIASQERISNESIAANQAMAAAKLNAQISMLQSNNDLQRYGLDLTAQNLPQILHSQEIQQQTAAANAQALASISAQQNQAIAALNTQAARTQANSMAQSSTIGDIGSLLGMAGGASGIASGISDIGGAIGGLFGGGGLADAAGAALAFL
jgi:hypothetical protein